MLYIFISLIFSCGASKNKVVTPELSVDGYELLEQLSEDMLDEEAFDELPESSDTGEADYD